MHFWGSEFPYFAEVDQAADDIGKFCRRWGRINVTTTKEKYGSARVYCTLGWSSLLNITHPGYVYYPYPKWLIHLDVYGLGRLFNLVNRIVIPYHKFIYRLAYKRAIRKYPMIVPEILSGADWDELLKDLWPKEIIWSMYLKENSNYLKCRDRYWVLKGRWDKLAEAYRILKSKGD